MLSSSLLKVHMQPLSNDGQEYPEALVSDPIISVRVAQSRSSSPAPVAFSFSVAEGTVRLFGMRRRLKAGVIVLRKSLLCHKWSKVAKRRQLAVRLRLGNHCPKAFVYMVKRFLFLHPVGRTCACPCWTSKRASLETLPPRVRMISSLLGINWDGLVHQLLLVQHLVSRDASAQMEFEHRTGLAS